MEQKEDGTEEMRDDDRRSSSSRSRKASAEWMEWPADLKVNLVCEGKGDVPHAKNKVKASRHSLASRAFLPATLHKAEQALKKPIMKATRSFSPRHHKEQKKEGDEEGESKAARRNRRKLQSEGSVPASVFEKLGVRQEKTSSFVQVIHQGYLYELKTMSGCFPGHRLSRKWFVVTEFGELRFSNSALQADVMKPFFKHIEFEPLTWLGIKEGGELNGMIVSLHPLEEPRSRLGCLPHGFVGSDTLYGFRVTATFERTKHKSTWYRCFCHNKEEPSTSLKRKKAVRELYAPSLAARDQFMAAILHGLSRLHSGGGCRSMARFQRMMSYPLASEMLDFQMVEYADRERINQSGMV